jgi:hypothetical protein
MQQRERQVGPEGASPPPPPNKPEAAGAGDCCHLASQGQVPEVPALSVSRPHLERQLVP